MLTPEFSQQSERDRYDAFMGELVALVVDEYDGSLKAEHGTGLNMAPFVEHEWGTEATELMWRVKALADPDGVLGPGVVLNRDPGVHLRNLKTTPEIEETGGATTCVECGFCEPVCPSRDLTTTPRQRIVLRRELARQPAGSPVGEALAEQYEYDGLQTCAADGSCALVCPLGIDTGKLVKGLRCAQHSARAERVALRVAERWDRVERLARAGLGAGDTVARVAGDAPLRAASRLARAVAGTELVPEWPRNMPHPAPPLMPGTTRAGAAAVYLPACINRIFGAPRDGAQARPSLPAALVAVSQRAGLPVWIPEDVAGRCCGTPWTSKGYIAGGEWMRAHVADSLAGWTEQGALPVVVDATSCSHALAEDVAEQAGVEVIDSIAWARDHLLDRLQVTRRLGSIAVHPSCAARHMSLAGALADVSAALAEEVVVPTVATCCGFAGDRGFLHPELTAAATAPAARELAGRRFDAYVCANRTCEIGLQQATGAAYTSVIQVLEEATRPA
jgi:D-lactate dehydrogenase